MTCIAAACTSRNLAPGTAAANAGVGGVEHRLVDAALDLGERAVDRQRARDVGGVEGVDLDARRRRAPARPRAPGRRCRSSAASWRARRTRRSSRSRPRCPPGRACPTNVPSMTRSPRRCAIASGSARTIFSKPSIVVSTARRICSISCASLTSRSSESASASFSSRSPAASVARISSTTASIASSTSGTTRTCTPSAPTSLASASRRSSTCAVRTPGEASRGPRASGARPPRTRRSGRRRRTPRCPGPPAGGCTGRRGGRCRRRPCRPRPGAGRAPRRAPARTPRPVRCANAECGRNR